MPMPKRNDNTRRRELIRRSLFISRISQSEVARRAGVTRGLVCHVIAGRRRHEGVRRILATVVGLSADVLWEE